VDFSVYDLLDDSSLAPSPSIYGEFDLVLVSNRTLLLPALKSAGAS